MTSLIKEAVGRYSSVTYSKAREALKNLGFDKEEGTHEEWRPSKDGAYPTHYPEDFYDTRFSGNEIVYRQHRGTHENIRSGEYTQLRKVLEGIDRRDVYNRLAGLKTKKKPPKKPEPIEEPKSFIPKWAERAFHMKKKYEAKAKFGKTDLSSEQINNKIFENLSIANALEGTSKEDFLEVLNKADNENYIPSRFNESDIFTAIQLVNSLGEAGTADLSLDIMSVENIDELTERDYDYHIKNLVKKKKVAIKEGDKPGPWISDPEDTLFISSKLSQKLLKTAAFLIEKNLKSEAITIYKRLLKNKMI
jgi:hypothetical protein